MQMLYNSDSYAVVQFDLSETPATDAQGGGGYEIVDKFARKDIYIQGELAASFKKGVQALVDAGGPNVEALDEFIAGFTAFAQQPLVLH